MNTRTAATLVLALASATGVHAQVELPYQWVGQQMKAAQQDRDASVRLPAIAPSATAAVTAATPVAANPAASALTQQALRPASVAATQSSGAQR